MVSLWSKNGNGTPCDNAERKLDGNLICDPPLPITAVSTDPSTEDLWICDAVLFRICLIGRLASMPATSETWLDFEKPTLSLMCGA